MSINIRNDYSPFGAPLPGRTYQQGKFDAKVVNLTTGNITTTTGWTTIFCTNPTTCTSPETAVTLTATGGKLRMQTNKRYSQAYYTFTTVPGRVYKVKYRLSGVTFGLTNTSIFAPAQPKELYTSANLSIAMVNNVDREMIFTATEASVRFYITRGWAPGLTTPTVEEVSLDYLNITEVASQINTISCTSINENMVMLANSGVNTVDMTTVANILNAYYNCTYTAAEYQAILNHCIDLPASYVLAKEGAEAASVEASYQFGFNGMEKDNDTYGEGNAYDFGARIYDSRLGRWLSKDPLETRFPGISAYNFSMNCPLVFNDPDGNSGRVTIQRGENGGGTIVMETTVYLYGQTEEVLNNTAKAMNEAYGKMKNTATVKDAEGNCWQVTIKVHYVATPAIKTEDVAAIPGGTNDPASKNATKLPEPVKLAIGFQNGDNILQVENSGQSVQGHTYQGATSAVSTNNAAAIFEETFHMLGFDEQYPSGFGTGSGDPKMAGSVMATAPGGVPKYIHQVLFYDAFKTLTEQFGKSSNVSSQSFTLPLNDTNHGNYILDETHSYNENKKNAEESVNTTPCKK